MGISYTPIFLSESVVYKITNSRIPLSTLTFCRISYMGIIILIIEAYVKHQPRSVSLLNVGQVRRKLYGKSWAKPIRVKVQVR